MADRVELNHAAIREFLRSPAVLAEMERRAARISAAAGPGHEVEGFVGANRARATVRTATIPAAVLEARDHTLLRALGAARG